MSIQKTLKENIPDLIGNLEIKYTNRVVLISGNVSTSEPKKFSKLLTELIQEKYPLSMTSSSLKLNEFSVSEDSITTTKTNENVLDEVGILYYGFMSVNLIKENAEFKNFYYPNYQKFDNCVKALNFISPIILDSDLKVIDGNTRLQLAKDNGIDKVLVVILDSDKIKSDFLRLSLNRSSEFQRWNYKETDAYVDNNPQVQALTEPLGFFGQKVLPTSYFSNTVVNYIIDPFNEKQKQYDQEKGLAEWAEYRRNEMKKQFEESRRKKEKKKGNNVVSLFDLIPSEEDFLDIYDIDKEMSDHVEKYKEIAGNITDKLDAIKKEELERTGGEWQLSHRSSKEKAEDTRKAAIKKIESYSALTEEEKSQILANLDDFAEFINNEESLINIIRGEENE